MIRIRRYKFFDMYLSFIPRIMELLAIVVHNNKLIKRILMMNFTKSEETPLVDGKFHTSSIVYLLPFWLDSFVLFVLVDCSFTSRRHCLQRISVKLRPVTWAYRHSLSANENVISTTFTRNTVNVKKVPANIKNILGCMDVIGGSDLLLDVTENRKPLRRSDTFCKTNQGI